jgi:hypothetical protein
MSIWYTWLGYLGLLCGLGASAIFGIAPVRSAAVGFASGIVLVILVNMTNPVPPPCLQSSRGGDILRAYSLDCGDPLGVLR